MWTRERWLTVAELCGFASVAAGLAVATFAVVGGLASLAAGLIAAGVELVYLANAYALPETKANA